MVHFFLNLGTNVLLALPNAAAYALFALGVVVIYRASRVLNLAHGAMAMVPGYVAYALAGTVGAYAALGSGILTGGLLGMLVERLVVRRLRRVSETAQTVGTVAVFGLLVAVTAKITHSALLPAVALPFLPTTKFKVGFALMSYNHVALIVVAVLGALLFFALFKFTNLGLAMRLAADNRRAAALMGVNPDRTTAAAWLIGGLFAGLGGILLAAATALDPYLLPLQVLPAFVAALIGGLDNPVGALGGALVVGVAIGVIPGLFGIQAGSDKLIVAVVALVIMARRGSKLQASDVRTGLT